MSRRNFMPLSDEDDDDDYAKFSVDGESTDKGHSRQGSAEDGHLYAGHHSTAGMRASQKQRSARGSGDSRAAFGDTSELSRGSQAMPQQDALQAIKVKSLGLAAYLREKASAASTSVADPAARQQTLSRLRYWGAGAAERMQSATVSGWQQARDLTSEGIKRLTGGPLEGMCKQEHTERPCPRTILVCCTAIVTNGLYTEGIFNEEAPMELVHYLLGAFEEGQGLCMPPPGTAPLVIATALKHFLKTLSEPLLTYRGIPAIVAAGRDTVAHKAPEALAELPPASLNALTVLLETWHRVAENSSTNGMDAMALAVAMAPCLAWNPPPGKEARKGYQAIGAAAVDDGTSWRRGLSHSQPETASADLDEAGAMSRTDLEPEDLAAIIAVLEYVITNFRGTGTDINSPLYDTFSTDSKGNSAPATLSPAHSDAQIAKIELARDNSQNLSRKASDQLAPSLI